MFSSYPGSTVVDVQGLKCNIPPTGYVFNILTQQLERRPIWQRSPKKSDQYWERQEPPAFFKKADKEEEKAQETDKEYTDPKLDDYRAQEWDRRMNGFWFMNNGVPTYITGAHYMYMNWWKIDVGYPKFRLPDQEYFYFLQYCIEDPLCMGMCEVTKRRFGKTYRGGLFVYDYPSYHEQARSGIQSKTGKDGKKVFSKAVISPFKKLPRFFRPEYDKSQGITPKAELLFQATNKKGKNSAETLDTDELESGIDWGTSEEMFYDGQKLYRYLSDESGKTIEVNVADRWEVVRYCLLDDEGKIIGKALFTTTVEEMEKGGGNFKEIWKNSDQNNKGKNGQTPSGLYRFFMDARKTRNFDRYGIPNEKLTEEEILLARELVADNPRSLSARIRKEPFTQEEAFRIDGDQCHFNAMKLNGQRDFLGWNKDCVEYGNFVWKDGVRDTEVIWQKNAKGRWAILRGWTPNEGEVNNVRKMGTMYYPLNNNRFGGGCDPYDHDVTEDNKRSMAAAIVKAKTNFQNPDDPFIGAYIVKYIARPNTSNEFYEDMIKQCYYFSYPILVENNKQGIIKYFKGRGYTPFLMKLKGYKEVGIPSTPENKAMAMELVEALIEDSIDKIYFIDVIEDWLEFDVKETRIYDLSMASLWTEIACMNVFRIADSNKKHDIKDFLKMKKVRAISG